MLSAKARAVCLAGSLSLARNTVTFCPSPKSAPSASTCEYGVEGLDHVSARHGAGNFLSG